MDEQQSNDAFMHAVLCTRRPNQSSLDISCQPVDTARQFTFGLQRMYSSERRFATKAT